MKPVMTLIAIAFLIGACDPQDTYNDCQAQGQESDAMCGFRAFSYMWTNPDWYN